MNTPIYLRDLKENAQQQFIREWEQRRSFDVNARILLEAYSNGQDIEIGCFNKNFEAKVSS